MQVFNDIGSAMLIVVICYIIVDIFSTKKLTLKGLISRLVFIFITIEKLVIERRRYMIFYNDLMKYRNKRFKKK